MMPTPVTLTDPKHLALFARCRARWPDFALHREEYRAPRAPAAAPPEWTVTATCTAGGKPYELSFIEERGVDAIGMVLHGALKSESP